MPFVVTSCAFMTHRASRPSRSKPVLICILACSLAFRAITFELYENGLFKNEASVAMNPLVSLFCCLVARSRRKPVVTDRQTDTLTN